MTKLYKNLTNSIHIAIDGNEANVSQRVGSNVYAFEVIHHLERLTRPLKNLNVTVLLSKMKQPDLPPARIGWLYRVVPPKFFWTQWALPIHLFFNKHLYDVFFTPGHYAPRIATIPYVCSVMDLAFLKYPDQFRRSDYLQLKNWTDYSVRNAKKIIAISEFTRHEVIKHYQRKAPDVIVAYPSTNLAPACQKQKFAAFLKEHHITTPYILYMGTLQPRKNLVNLVEAYEIFCRSLAASSLTRKRKIKKNHQQKILPKLVIAGKIGWMAEDILKRIEQSPFKSQIILTDYVEESIKIPLFKHALCSVLIGLYEGFGIPALESLVCGTIPIVSNNSSLPEVVGKAGVLVNPQKTISIADGLAQVWQLTTKQKHDLTQLAVSQILKFNWSDTAEIILNQLVKIAIKTH